jgi:hypothetical protein
MREDFMQQTAQVLHNTLEDFRASGAHLLLPSTHVSELPRFHKIVVDEVYLSPKTEDGDVYPQQTGGGSPAKYAPTRQGLMKLANAAGIMWDPARCQRLDDRRDKEYVSYQAVGGIKKIDGSPLFFKAEYDLDFEVVEEEIREGYENKARMYDKDRQKYGWWHKMDGPSQEAYIEKCIRRDVLQKRKHKAKLAETGAMTRVVRALLGLKSAYTAKELEKPFIVVRTVFQPDYSDPETKRQIAAASVQAVAGIFGPIRQQPQLRLVSSAMEEPESGFPEPIDVPDSIDDGAPNYTHDDMGVYEDRPAPPSTLDETDPQTADFLALDIDGRISCISEAAKSRGMADSKAMWRFYQSQTGASPPKSVKAMPASDMVALFKAILALPPVPAAAPAPEPEQPEREPGSDDDIPF